MALEKSIGGEPSTSGQEQNQSTGIIGLPMTSAAIELLQKPRKDLIKIRAQLEDANMSYDQGRATLRSWKLGALSKADVVSICANALQRPPRGN